MKSLKALDSDAAMLEEAEGDDHQIGGLEGLLLDLGCIYEFHDHSDKEAKTRWSSA